MFFWEEEGNVYIKVKVLPRSSQNQVVGVSDGALKVKVTAPPVEGEANTACRELLAKTLGVSRSKVEVVAGHTSRSKILLVNGLGAAGLSVAFEKFLK